MSLFKALISTEEPDIIGITETWIHTNTRDFEGEFDMSGYKMFKKDRPDREGGGVLLYVRDYLSPIDCKLETEHEMIGIVLNKPHRKLYIYLLYRPPDQSAEKDESLYGSLSNYINNKLCIVAGDFNCRVNWINGTTADAESKRLLDFANEEYLTQWVNEPTRGNNVLDLVFSSEDNIISNLSVGEKLGKGDHRMVRFEIETSFTRVDKSFKKLNFKRADFDRFRTEMKKVPISREIEVEQRWLTLRNKFIEIQDDCIPKSKITPNGIKQPSWFNNDIAKAIRDRQKAHKISEREPSETSIMTHKKMCRKVDKLIRKAKMDEEDKIASIAKENPKAFFGQVSSRKPIKSSIGPLKNIEGNIISSDEGMAELLNGYFASVYTKENISEIPDVPIAYRGNNPLRKIDITEEKVKRKIKKLNPSKSQGPDSFHPRVIKEIETEITPHLCKIYKASLEQRKAVADWKIQNIAPIHKKGSKDEPGNYRPISLTSVPGKILESIVVDEIVNHLESNKLILDSQHGFRNGRSCLTNLLDFFHDMYSTYDSSRAIDILYLDFQKAFDKVPHKRLMAKIRSLGIIEEAADWIENWLSNRKQQVVINGTSSGWEEVTSGVPQGSVLGPLLFIIYINDLDLGLVSKISKFADDTKLGIKADEIDAVKQLQEDLNKIGEWSVKWQMPFNVDKCKVMHIGYKNINAKYELLGKNLESCSEEKDLGVVITNDLKPSKQCIEAEKKAQKILGYIKRHFKTRKKETILTLYNTLVRPHLEYAVQFWAPSQRKDIERLEAVQARATKLIPSIRHLNYHRRLNRLNMFSLEKRRLRGQLIETFKILNGINNVNSERLFSLNNNYTRSNGRKLQLKRFNTSLCGNFFTYKMPSYWNRLPSDVVNSTTINQFKNRLDKVFDRLF